MRIDTTHLLFRGRVTLIVGGRLLALCAVLCGLARGQDETDLRRTAIVRAVEAARACVVNIHGQKTITAADDPTIRGDAPKRVNGMGTGIVLDERGYILTNYHVVDGVKKIEVTLADKSNHIAKFISGNAAEDLAVIKVDLARKFSLMKIGTSGDLMVGEPVIAMGNAYGYEHTVTQGIISALHRSVQISDTQSYDDLIQTDASINPGNSGGPLMNIHGELIGVNVAVRAGASGIGFAIPADKALAVAAELLSVERLENRWHGITVKADSGDQPGLEIAALDKLSPAAELGLQPGDRIVSIDQQAPRRALDLERALLGRKASGSELLIKRQGEQIKLTLALAAKPRTVEENDPYWQQLGLKLQAAPAVYFKQGASRYRGGLAVVAVRGDGPAAKQGIRKGDILVGMHVWETISLENVDYVLNRADLTEFSPIKFLVMRNGETLFGHMPLSVKR